MRAMPLHRVEQEYRSAIDGELRDLDLTPLDVTGVPTAAVLRTDPDGRRSNAVGYSEDPRRARIGALGELSEGIFSDAAVAAAPRERGSFDELVSRFGADHVADPLELVLGAGDDYRPDRSSTWVRMTRWRSGEEVLVPIEFVASRPAALHSVQPDARWLATPISNGLGAGMDLADAVEHGLLELLQRDGDTVSFRAMDQGIVVDPDSFDDPALDSLIAAIRATGIDVTLKFAADEFVPVLYCVGERVGTAEEHPIAMSAIGEAAHPDPREAARKAVLEFAASRARRIAAFGELDLIRRRLPEYIAEVESIGMPGGQEPRALAEMQRWIGMDPVTLRRVLEPIFRRSSTMRAGDLTTARSDVEGERMLPHLLDRLRDFDVLVLEGRPRGESPVRTAKVVVPRLEVETLSYSRIGERVAQRLLDRGDDLVTRVDGPDRARVRVTSAAEERLGGPVWLDQARLSDTLGPLYPLYREPSWHAAQLSLSV